MVFTNVYNPRSEIRRMSELKPTLVRRGATLGANCTILCGVAIGAYAFIGATWLLMKTDRTLQRQAAAWARRSLVGIIGALVTVSIATPAASPLTVVVRSLVWLGMETLIISIKAARW